jgi:hypothetical protein
LADTATEGVLVVGGVGDVELDTVDGHHPQIPQPGARGARPGQRPGHPRVEFADRLGTHTSAGLAQRRGASPLRGRRRRTASSPARSTRPPGPAAGDVGARCGRSRRAPRRPDRDAPVWSEHQGRSGRSTDPHDRVHHRDLCRSQVSMIRGTRCSTILLRANLRHENRCGHHITFTQSTHSASIECAPSQQLSTQSALTFNDAKVNGIGMKPGMVHVDECVGPEFFVELGPLFVSPACNLWGRHC